MKKLTTLAAALLLFAGVSFAAETKVSKHDSASDKAVTSSSSSLVSARSIASIIEENTALRLQVEDLTATTENLNDLLDYQNMMHATIDNLHEENLKQQQEESAAQLDYARMMSATILNLGNVLANN